MRTSNPAFSSQAFGPQAYDYDAPRAGTMTVQGTISKSALLLAILSATALWSWSNTSAGNASQALIFGSMIAGMVVGLITVFRPTVAPWTAPVYAALEGVFLGAVSYLFQKASYQGIALQAIGLTVGTLAMMLALYATRVIRVTDKLRSGIMAATGALMLVYLVTFVLRMFGMSVPFIHSGGAVGILFSLFVVGLAAFNLLLDFDVIEQGSASGAPRSMEWYGAFGLMVTLIWLYLEVLRLLSKIYSDRR